MSNDDRDLVASLLEAGRRDVAPDEAERQSRIYAGVIAAASGSSGHATAGTRGLGSWTGLTVVGLGALVLASAGALALSRSDAPSSAPPAAAAPLAETTPSAALDAPSVASAPGTSVWELPSARETKKPAAAASRERERDGLALELAAIESARRKLREHDPAGALALLDDYDRRFPHPRVADEAAVLRVEVLFALGRDDEARRLGHDFVERRPGSIYRARVAQLVEGGAR